MNQNKIFIVVEEKDYGIKEMFYKKKIELTKILKVSNPSSKYKHLNYKRICIWIPYNKKIFKELKKLEDLSKS